MPDDLYDDELDDDEDLDDDGSGLVKKLRRQLRDQGKELKSMRETAEQASAATRDLAFLRAGVNLDDPKAKYLVEGYKGDLSDIDAIKSEAAVLGLIEPPAKDENIEGHQAANAAAEGADGVQPSENRDAEYESEMAKATSQDEILAVMDKYGSPHTDAEYV